VFGVFGVIVIIGVALYALNAMDQSKRAVFLIKWKYPIRVATFFLIVLGGFFAYQEYSHQAELSAHRAALLANDKAEVAKVRAGLVSALAQHGMKPHPASLFATGRSSVDLMKSKKEFEGTLYEKMEAQDTIVFQSDDYIPGVEFSNVLPADSKGIYCSQWVKKKARGLFGNNYDTIDNVKVGGHLIEFSVAESEDEVRSYFVSQASAVGFTPDSDEKTRGPNNDTLFRNDEFMEMNFYHGDPIANDVVSVNICFGKIIR
jgi:hypothetical protein